MFAQIELDDLTTSLDSGLDGWDYGRAGLLFVGGIIVGRLLKLVIRRAFGRTSADDFLGDLFGRMAAYLSATIGLIYALEGLGVAVGPLLGALGIAGIAIAFALQDILENFVAGILIQLRRPFTSGDEIESGDHEGVVTAVDARTVTVRTPDGETIRLPSAGVIKSPIINHTQYGMRRTSLDVGVAYGTDLAVACAVAKEAAASVGGVHHNPGPSAFVHTFGASSIDISVRFWHEPSIASRWQMRNDVALALERSFADNAIQIPFPQRVVHRAPE